MAKDVVVIDYGLGNLFSVKQACELIGINATISSDSQDIDNAEAVILPGVGAFGEAMHNLKKLKLVDSIRSLVEDGRPIFGICLGLQLLFTESEEYGNNMGLGIIDGYVKKIPNIYQGLTLKVPHVGWNSVNINQRIEQSPLNSIDHGEYFYFVHSLYVVPQEKDYIIATTNYNNFEYCSVLSNHSNIFATQFHPEKSGKKGLSIYKNWAYQNKLIS